MIKGTSLRVVVATAVLASMTSVAPAVALGMKKLIVRKLHCAVYTRKSGEEGLDMEFNSLDAQRESCEAYVASQKPEG
jgi:hypothetical protein